MKKIYYQKSSFEYEIGYFISSKIIIRFLIIFMLIFYYNYYNSWILNLPDWSQIPLLIFFIVSFFYLVNIGMEEKNKLEVDKYKYLNKKIKKQKGKTVSGSYGKNFVSLIGDYEFDSIVTYNQKLLDFYENCLIELDELKKNDIKKFNSVEIVSNKNKEVHHHNNKGKINFEKFFFLKRRLIYRIEILKKINELAKD